MVKTIQQWVFGSALALLALGGAACEVGFPLPPGCTDQYGGGKGVRGQDPRKSANWDLVKTCPECPRMRDFCLEKNATSKEDVNACLDNYESCIKSFCQKGEGEETSTSRRNRRDGAEDKNRPYHYVPEYQEREHTSRDYREEGAPPNPDEYVPPNDGGYDYQPSYPSSGD